MTIFQPFGERVLVKIVAQEETTESGLLVKPVDKDNSNRGIVEAVGEGTLLQDGTLKPLSISVGDYVLFNAGAGTKINEGSETYTILNAREILGKLIKEN